MRLCFLLILLLFSQVCLKATHVIGGNFELQHLGGDTYEVQLIVFRDCSPGTLTMETRFMVDVFDAVNHEGVASFFIYPQDTLDVKLGDACHTPDGLCIEEYTFKNTINLPPRPNGYLLTTGLCCRNGVIKNIVGPLNTATTWTAFMAAPTGTGLNASPQLGAYPPSGYLCLNRSWNIDLEASDPDGDSLAYRLVDPYDGRFTSTPPFPPVVWQTGFSATAPIPGMPNLTLDSKTGILSCRASELGIYVLAYEVEEYRNGSLIGSIRRDLQIQVLDCVLDLPPQISEPVDSIFSFDLHEDGCIDIIALDGNTTDTLLLNIEVTASANLGGNLPVGGSLSGIGSIHTQLCWTPNCANALEGQEVEINLSATSSGCRASTVNKKFTLSIEKLLPDLAGIMPNVFTPNGDRYNEYYKPTRFIESLCTEGLNISIFNRWGALVHQDQLAKLQWDGTSQGQPLASGVYFYVVDGKYVSENVKLKGYFTLIR